MFVALITAQTQINTFATFNLVEMGQAWLSQPHALVNHTHHYTTIINPVHGEYVYEI